MDLARIQFINAFPSSSPRMLLNDQSFRISVGRRVEAPLFHSQSCVYGEILDKIGLACKKSAERKAIHELLTDLINGAHTSCNITSIRERMENDGKRPDGFTITSWKRNSLVEIYCVGRK